MHRGAAGSRVQELRHLGLPAALYRVDDVASMVAKVPRPQLGNRLFMKRCAIVRVCGGEVAWVGTGTAHLRRMQSSGVLKNALNRFLMITISDFRGCSSATICAPGVPCRVGPFPHWYRCWRGCSTSTPTCEHTACVRTSKGMANPLPRTEEALEPCCGEERARIQWPHRRARAP